MTEVVDTMHFSIGGTGNPLNFLKEWRDWKEIVFHMLHAGAEAQTFGLASTGTMNETRDGRTHLTQKNFGHGQIGAGGTKEGLADGEI